MNGQIISSTESWIIYNLLFRTFLEALKVSWQVHVQSRKARIEWPKCPFFSMDPPLFSEILSNWRGFGGWTPFFQGSLNLPIILSTSILGWPKIPFFGKSHAPLVLFCAYWCIYLPQIFSEFWDQFGGSPFNNFCQKSPKSCFSEL